jgi:tight adherence protein C
MLLLLTTLLILSAVTAGAYGFWVFFTADRAPAAARLRQIRMAHTGGADIRFGGHPPLPLEFLAWLGGFLPAHEGRDALRTGLVQAGYRKPEAPLVMLGFKLLFATLLPLAWLSFSVLAARPIPQTAPGLAIAALLGFYLPTVYVGWRKARRRESITLTLPDALDLMVVCVEAGLGITAAMQRVAMEMALASSALSEELGLVHHEMQAGVSRSDALRSLAMRSGVDEVYSLVAMLIQTDRLGTSVAQALRAHADAMRTRRRQRAEQTARKASVKLAFPLVLLIFPALLVVILGPAVIQLAKALVEGP